METTENNNILLYRDLKKKKKMELIFTLVFLDRERANEAASYSQLSIMFIYCADKENGV